MCELRAAIIAIGTELTIGLSSESNSEFIGRWLHERGVHIQAVIKLPDNQQAIAGEIDRLAAENDILILTGGLGSTHDDVTREALASALEQPLEAEARISSDLIRLMPVDADREQFLKQAFLPAGARPIRRQGTAPGIHAIKGDADVFALPGVPREMKSMLDYVEKALRANLSKTTRPISTTLKMSGASEPVIAKIIDPIIKKNLKATFNILAKADEITLTIIAGAESDLDRIVAQLKPGLGDYLYGFNGDTMSAVVGRLLVEKKLRLGTAESITGGQIGSIIAENPGSSAYFSGSIVAYSNSIKEKLLAVSHETLVKHGAVSAEVAREMASGATAALDANIGLAVTGIAGPGGATTKKPIGLIYIAISTLSDNFVTELRFSGVRAAIQRKTAVTALNLLRLFLLDRQ